MPDVGFRLFGDASSFERAVNSAKGGVLDLDKRVQGAQKVISGFGRIAGPAMAIAGAFIAGAKSAQALRDEAEKSGKALDENIAAGARLGDTFDTVIGKVKGGLATAVGFVTKQVENLVYTASGLDDDAFRAELEARAKAAAFSEAEKKTNEEIAKKKKEAEYAAATSAEKINKLFAENVSLNAEMNSLGEHDKRRLEIKKQISENDLRLKQEGKKAQEELNKLTEAEVDSRNEVVELRKQEAAEVRKANALRAAAAQRVTNAQQNLNSANVDSSKMSLDELASIPTFASGVSIDLTDAARGAREAKALEQKAEEARRRGDQKGAQDFAGQALAKRKSLGDFLRAGEANPQASLEDAVTEAQAEAAELGGSDVVARNGDGTPRGGWKAVASAAEVSVVDNMRAVVAGRIPANGPAGKDATGGGKDSSKLDGILEKLTSIDNKFGGVVRRK